MDKTRSGRIGPFFFRPADKTVESYREFILGMAKALNPGATDDLTGGVAPGGRAVLVYGR